MRPLLELVIEKIPGPIVRPDDPLQLMVTSLEWSRYVGRVATGRIAAGRIRTGQQIALMRADGSRRLAKVDQVQLFDNLGRSDAEEACAGDIVAVIGLPDPEIGDTIADPLTPVALERIAVDEPTLSMKFTINSSPLAGQHGKFVTSSNLRDRLYRELNLMWLCESKKRKTKNRLWFPVEVCCIWQSSSKPCVVKDLNFPLASRKSSSAKSTARSVNHTSCWKLMCQVRTWARDGTGRDRDAVRPRP